MFCFYLIPVVPALIAEQYTGQGSALMTNTTTIEQARQRALNQARLHVVQQSGIHISSASEYVNNLMAGSFLSSSTRGVIVAEDILAWNMTLRRLTQQELPIPVVTVTIRATVDNKGRNYYRPYLLDTAINKRVLSDQELIQVSVRPKIPMYIFIANLINARHVRILYPKTVQEMKAVGADTLVHFPGVDSGIQWQAQAAHEGDAQEMLIIIGVPVTQATKKLAAGVFAGLSRMPFAEFYHRIDQLPVEWMAKKVMGITIAAKRPGG